MITTTTKMTPDDDGDNDDDDGDFYLVIGTISGMRMTATMTTDATTNKTLDDCMDIKDGEALRTTKTVTNSCSTYRSSNHNCDCDNIHQ